MTRGRNSAIENERRFYDSGEFFNRLKHRISVETESQKAEQAPTVRAYLTDEIARSLAKFWFTSHIVENPENALALLLLASRIRDSSSPTVLNYGHGAVVSGHADRWNDWFFPWTLTAVGDFLYGRGSADNKGQHAVYFAALTSVIEPRGGNPHPVCRSRFD